MSQESPTDSCCTEKKDQAELVALILGLKAKTNGKGPTKGKAEERQCATH